jgi:hypothetical protein
MCGDQIYFVKEDELVYVDYSIMQIKCGVCGYVNTFNNTESFAE